MKSLESETTRIAAAAGRVIEALKASLWEARYAFKENYITAHAQVAWWESHINNQVLQQYEPILSGAVADFGCNHGACTILAARSSSVREVVGFDRNGAAIARANRLLCESREDGRIQAKVRFVRTRFSGIRWPDSYFDGGFMFHVLEHVFPGERVRVLGEVSRVMKPGAHLVVTVPFEHAYDDGRQHVAFFNETSLREALEEGGFEVLDCYRDRRADAHTPQGHDCLNAVCQTPGKAGV